jgi:5'-nucleotidase
MRLLITNDDGIYSPGIRVLAHIARRFGDVCVVAPDVERSSTGHAITSNRPLRFHRTSFEGLDGYRVDGTPADCVALGMHRWGDVDVVLSGINMGPNIGSAIWHSGTLAGAKQGVLFGARGIALSTPVPGEEPDWERLTPYVEQTLDLLLPDDGLELVNVNFPPAPEGLRWAKQSVRQYDGMVQPGTDPMGRDHYWFTVSPIEATEEDTDRWAVEHGYVAMTPLRLELTDHDELQAARARHPLTDVISQP